MRLDPTPALLSRSTFCVLPRAASPLVRTSVTMPQRDSCTSALAPRLSPKARGSMSSRTQAAGVSGASRRITFAVALARVGFGCYRRARLSALAGGAAFGSGVGLGALAIASLSPVSMTASSNFAIAARIGTSRGAWGNLSSSMVRRIAAVTAASSSSVRSIVGTARITRRESLSLRVLSLALVSLRNQWKVPC